MAAYDKGDIVMMKKAHPCGTNRWKITRSYCHDDPAKI